MSSDTLWLAAILLFFGSFAVVLFTVALWSGGDRRQQVPQTRPEPARRPEPASLPASPEVQRAALKRAG